MACGPLDNIPFSHQFSDLITTAGLPSVADLTHLSQSGCEAVINLYPNDAPHALSDEARLVSDLGMAYTHIPVPWSQPELHHLEQFFATLTALRGRRLFIHCAANKRVSLFLALWRMADQGWSRSRAEAELHQRWQPNEVWQQFFDRHALRLTD